MGILLPTPLSWADYELLDTGDYKRLERFGKYILVRPDPQVIWSPHLASSIWEKADAVFEPGSNGTEQWVQKTKIPEKWLLHYGNINFWAKLTPFKHTGVFPEQVVQWQWIDQQIRLAKRDINVLNLFAYTGISSLVSAYAGATVTHVDASRPTIGWAKENQIASKLENKQIRWILDDAIKFTQREIKRGIRYDAIIMDPPAYGHGPEGERWEFHKDFPKLLANCRQLLSEQPLFVLINAYAISSSALMFENVLSEFSSSIGGKIAVGELVLQETGTKRLLSTGIFGRWSNS